MRKLDSYLSEYQESHKHPMNVTLHTVCVPAIMWSLLVFLSTYTFTEYNLPDSCFLLLLTIVFFLLISTLQVTFVMTLTGIIMIMSTYFIPHARWISIGVFVLAWVGQFYGHKIEGKKPSFFKDLLFLMIGPVWVFKKWRLL